MSKKSFVEDVCQILVEKNLIQPQRAAELIEIYKGKSRLDFENFVVEEGLVSRAHLLQALAIYYKTVGFDAAGYFFDHFLVKQFPKEILLVNGMIPLEVENDTILIMIASIPNDDLLGPIIGKYASWEVEYMVGLHQDIIDAIEEYYDEPLTVSDADEYIAQEDQEEHKALEIAKRKIRYQE